MGKLIQFPAPAPLRGLYEAGRDRKQAIRSARWTIDAAAEALGGIVPLDPCAHRLKRFHFAEDNWTHSALERTWHKPSYANVPFKFLVPWLQYAQQQAHFTGLPTLVLHPWRSHRLGYLDAIRGALIVYFKAFAFEGQTNTAPFPVVLAAWNCTTWPRTPYELERRMW